MMLQPSSPLSLPKPFGKRCDTEFSMMNVEPNVDAHRKITLAVNSGLLARLGVEHAHAGGAPLSSS